MIIGTGYRRCLVSARTSFSLIELLVVVAIIAVLVAVLLPETSRDRGKGIVCANDTRRMGLNAHPG